MMMPQLDLASKPSTKQRKLKEFREHIRIDWKKVGTIRGAFLIENVPQIQQMGTGLITENGIEKKSFSDFLNLNHSCATCGIPEEVKELQTLKEKIIKEFLSLNQQLALSKANKMEFLKNKDALLSLVNKMAKRDPTGNLRFGITKPDVLLET